MFNYMSAYSAFEGRVLFHMRHMSIKTARKVDELEAQFKEAAPELVDEYPGLLRLLPSLLATTELIAFRMVGDETAMLTDFQEFWGEYVKLNGDGKKAAKLAIDWVLDTSHAIYDEWVNASNIAQMPYRNPVTLPESALTEAEKETMQDMEAPLDGSA